MRACPPSLRLSKHVGGLRVAVPWPTVRPSWLRVGPALGVGVSLVALSVFLGFGLMLVSLTVLCLWTAVVLAARWAWTNYMRMRAPRTLVLSAHCLEWEGQRVDWREIERVSVEPYARFSASYIRCVDVRLRDGQRLSVAWGADMDGLEWLLLRIKRAWRSAQGPQGPVDHDGLDALDELLGRGRSGAT